MLKLKKAIQNVLQPQLTELTEFFVALPFSFSCFFRDLVTISD